MAKSKKNQQFRQGDVFVVASTDEVQVGNQIPADNGRVVLAYGEVTGHAHALPADAAMLFEIPNSTDRLLRVVKKTSLRHEEHGAIDLVPGDYRITRQREYTPEEIKFVAD